MSATFLALLAGFPDTHVARKHGDEMAQRLLRERHARSTAACRQRRTRRRLAIGLLELDRELKDRGINPGTSADLTVASHFAAGLEAADDCRDRH